MGVVYEARQLSLGRRVAVKILPFAGVLDERALARFHIEAKAAATLHHNHVVPVHFVGCDRGVHYYSMQLIDGVSIAEVLKALKDGKDADHVDVPTNVSTVRNASFHETTNSWKSSWSSKRLDYFREVVKAVFDAAEAVDHAHRCGVLHRDIKPGNLLLDHAGKIWVTDFGLARLDGNGSLSMTGDLAGTLRYLPPEVIKAERPAIDHRADVYSLGVTLYEMLVFQPAFDEHDRAKLIKEILLEEPVALRAIDPSVPVELETIVQRAMEKRPEDRFSSAQAMADELRRYLEHQPLQIEPPGLILRAKKWCRRHPAVTSALGAASIVAFLAMVVISILSVISQRELSAAIESERQQRRLAAENLKLAKEAVDEWYVRFGDEWISDQSGLTGDQHELLLKAAKFYQMYAAADVQNGFRLDQAVVLDRLASVQLSLGLIDEATKSITDAIAIAERAQSQATSLDEYLILPDLRLTLANVYSSQKEIERQYQTRLRILEDLERIPREFHIDPSWRLARAANRRRISENAWRLGLMKQADEFGRQAVDEIDELTRIFPKNEDYRNEKMWSYKNLVALRFKAISPYVISRELREGVSRQETAEIYREVVALAIARLNKNRASPNARTGFRNAVDLADIILPEEEAEPLLRRVAKIVAELRDENPERKSYVWFSSNAYHRLAEFYSRYGRYEKALEAKRQDIAIQRDMGERSSPHYFRDLAEAHRFEADLLNELGRFADAAKAYQDGLDIIGDGLGRLSGDESDATTALLTQERDMLRSGLKSVFDKE